ncbi:MAG: type I restriction enzyme HsdR N-terminal domain-containing protein [Desulfosudaceae bacterium]
MADTHDERARQVLARVLLDEKGFDRSQIETAVLLPVAVDNDAGSVRIDFVVRLNRRIAMIVIFGPGAIVSRQRPALAAGRLLAPYVIPRVVISNGEDAHVMNGYSGKVIGRGLAEIPSRRDVLAVQEESAEMRLDEDRRNKERRILFCMEVLTERECQCHEC